MSDNTFFVGLDLGQAQDYTALCILERIEGEPVLYHCRHLERFKLGTTYPAIVERLVTMCKTKAISDRYALVADATGVGRPVIDLLRAADLNTVAITITSGDTASGEHSDLRVPKRELVSSLQVLFQTGRLKFAEGLPDVPVLVNELLSFQAKITTAANDTYGAWREGVHDDLVLAVALAAWYAEHFGGPLFLW